MPRSVQRGSAAMKLPIPEARMSDLTREALNIETCVAWRGGA